MNIHSWNSESDSSKSVVSASNYNLWQKKKKKKKKKQKKQKKKKQKKKKNTDVKKTVNKAIKLLYWERQLLQAVEGDSNPTIGRINGAMYISINEEESTHQRRR